MDKLESVTLSVGEGDARAHCTICRFGAHIVSWMAPSVDKAPKERLWMSSLSCVDGSAPIRGGIPIAWPQFADNGPMKLHGFAREKLWSVGHREISSESDTIALSLDSDDSGMEDTRTKWNFPHAFTLQLTIRLSVHSLHMALAVSNKGTAPLPFTGCLHTYLLTDDSSRCSIEGLSSMRFTDKVDGYLSKGPVEQVLDIATEMASSAHLCEGKYFLDRIYDKPDSCRVEESTLCLVDASAPAHSVRTNVQQSGSWPQWVVFNPWIEGKKGDKGPDFDDDGYKHMVCLEPAIATEAVIVAPGECWVGTQLISVLSV